MTRLTSIRSIWFSRHHRSSFQDRRDSQQSDCGQYFQHVHLTHLNDLKVRRSSYQYNLNECNLWVNSYTCHTLLHGCASKMRRLVKCAVLYSIFSTVTPHPPGLLNRDTHADTDQSGRSSLRALCDIWGCVWCRGLHCAGGGRHGPFCVRGPFYSGPCANTLRSALSLLTQQRTR